MKKSLVIVAGICVLAAAAGGMRLLSAKQLEAPAAKAAPARPVAIAVHELPIKEFMFHVVAFSAQNIWDRQGWVTDKDGTHSLFPTDEHGWEDAESAALTLAEIMGLLVQPGRRMEVPHWDEHALLVREFALKAAAAAKEHDETSFMNAGTEIDDACDVCHRAVGLQ